MTGWQPGGLRAVLASPARFCRVGGGPRLRDYQQRVADAVLESVLGDKGWTIAVMFPRQSGKNELQAQLEAYLLFAFSESGAEMVKISPTLKPQSLNAMRRLERALNDNRLTRGRWKRQAGHLYRLGQSQIVFLSGAPESRIVGATASRLLAVDEAQDVGLEKYDKEIAPMAASSDATRVFWGTAWTSATLLARELETARAQQAADGKPRVFLLTADEVAREVPAYGRFVAAQVARLGRQHPLVRTQFFSETIDGGGGWFGPARRALMQGRHAAQSAPLPGQTCAFLLDVAGEDAGGAGASAYGDARLAHPGRDATALTIVAADLDSLEDEGLRAPTYRVVSRRLWLGAGQTQLYAEVRALAEVWGPRWVVVDATGVGAGLAAFLEKALPGRVIPFVFTAASKSRLGWDFLAVCDTGRWKEHRETDAAEAALQRLFWEQAERCQFRICPGPGRLLAWGAPDGVRGEEGQTVHDDLLVSAALAAVLDRQGWSAPGEVEVVRGRDPLAEMDREGY